MQRSFPYNFLLNVQHSRGGDFSKAIYLTHELDRVHSLKRGWAGAAAPIPRAVAIGQLSPFFNPLIAVEDDMCNPFLDNPTGGKIGMITMVKKTGKIPPFACINAPSCRLATEIVAKHVVVKSIFSVVTPLYNAGILP